MKQEVFWRNPGYKQRKSLKEDIECDYLIVGGGIMGVSLAYFLNKAGKKNIVLIEKNTIGSGATGKSAGFLALKGELDLRQIIMKYGKKRGLVYWKGNHEGLKLFEKIAKEEKIKCNFEPQNTIYGSVVKGIIDKRQEIEVLEEFIVEKDIEKNSELITGQDLLNEIRSPLFSYALKSYYHGASVNPLMFVQNLSKVIEKKHVKIYENTRFLNSKNNIAFTPHGKIRFKKILIAIDIATRNRNVKVLRSTIAITEKLSKEQLKEIGLWKHKMVWDSEDIYHYIKTTADNRLLVGYGDKKTHKRHPTTKAHMPHVKKIQKFIKKIFPQIKIKIDYIWSGNLGVTNDRIPLIELKGKKITVSGASSQVVCVMTAKHIVQKLIGKEHYLDEFFKHVKRTNPNISLFSKEIGLGYGKKIHK